LDEGTNSLPAKVNIGLFSVFFSRD